MLPNQQQPDQRNHTIDINSNQPNLYILAGGHSRRFGTDKASFILPNRQTWLEHVATALQPACQNIFIVCQHAKQDAFLNPAFAKWPKILDTDFTDATSNKAQGPLAGIDAALKHDIQYSQVDSHQNFPWICVVSCDLLRPQTGWIDPLLNASQQISQSNPACHYVAHTQQLNERLVIQPFPALYHHRFQTITQKHLIQKQLSLQNILKKNHGIHLRDQLNPDDFHSLQINTPDQLIKHWDNQKHL